MKWIRLIYSKDLCHLYGAVWLISILNATYMIRLILMIFHRMVIRVTLSLIIIVLERQMIIIPPIIMELIRVPSIMILLEKILTTTITKTVQTQTIKILQKKILMMIITMTAQTQAIRVLQMKILMMITVRKMMRVVQKMGTIVLLKNFII
jgi:hypothetical protein